MSLPSTCCQTDFDLATTNVKKFAEREEAQPCFGKLVFNVGAFFRDI